MSQFAPQPPPDLPLDAHKGIAGRVLVVAGSEWMPGAAILATRAAQRAGAGLVTVVVWDDSVRRTLPVCAPEAVMRDGSRLVRQYLRHRRQREALLVQALDQGGGTIDELLPKVYWDADRRLYPFAARSLLAGLEKLAEEGRAHRAGERWTAAALRP